MRYLKNIEVAEKYKVSPNTVSNWIDSAKLKKINLQLYDAGNRFYILNTPHNLNILKDLAFKSVRYKNKISSLTVNAKQEFYDIYNENQITDIITNIEVNKEIPMKYIYFNGGAENWNRLSSLKPSSVESNDITITEGFLKLSLPYILSMIKGFDKVNVIDIGPGNSSPVKSFLEELHNNSILGKYIAIDYSSDMLKFSEINIKKWFGNKIQFESYIEDITSSENLKNILFRNTHNLKEEPKTLNLILFMGGTIENFRNYSQSINIIKNSMGKNDIFVLEQRIDSLVSRLKLSFHGADPLSKDKDSDLGHRKLILELLNIPDNCYEIERVYDEEQKARLVKATFTKDVQININTNSYKEVLRLNNRDSLIFWRHNHHSEEQVITELSKVGFQFLYACQSLDRQDIIIISKLKAI